MPISNITRKKALEFLKVIEIGIKITNQSSDLDSKTKVYMQNHNDWNYKTVKDSLKDDDLHSASLKSLIDPFLVFWNESVGIDTEVFWDELNKISVNYKRKDPLKYALEKGKFRNVHQGMMALQNWSKLINHNILKSRLTENEINRINDIIKEDILKRVSLLRKCLNRKKILSSEYLRFGDSFAYLNNSNIATNYFTQNELERLEYIWKHFE